MKKCLMFICILFNFFSNNYLIILCPCQDYCLKSNCIAKASFSAPLPFHSRFMLRINQRMNIIQQCKDNFLVTYIFCVRSQKLFIIVG